MATTASAVAAKPSLTIKRRIKASPATLYRAWLEPQGIAQWFGAPDAAEFSADVDVRVGGRYVLRSVDPRGESMGVGGEYRELVPNEKIVFSWAWQSTPERVSQVTLTFKPDGAETILTLTHEMFADEAARNNHMGGWTFSLDRFAAHYNNG
jgi:uncharacterized protein YndB with AHSA1/START domain